MIIHDICMKIFMTYRVKLRFTMINNKNFHRHRCAKKKIALFRQKFQKRINCQKIVSCKYMFLTCKLHVIYDSTKIINQPINLFSYC